MKRFYILGIIVFVAILSSFGLFSPFITQAPQATAGDASSFCVIGEAKREIIADKATLTARIESISANKEEAQQKNHEAFLCAVEKLEKLGVEKNSIKEEFASVYPKQDCYAGSLTAYYATTNICFKLEDLKLFKNVIEALKECGITEIQSVNFEASTYQEEYNQTLKDAIENANVKASILANRKLQTLSVKEENTYCCNYVYRSYSPSMLEDDYTNKVCISAKVIVEFV